MLEMKLINTEKAINMPNFDKGGTVLNPKTPKPRNTATKLNNKALPVDG